MQLKIGCGENVAPAFIPHRRAVGDCRSSRRPVLKELTPRNYFWLFCRIFNFFLLIRHLGSQFYPADVASTTGE